MKYFVIAGETSGDHLGALLAKELKDLSGPSCRIAGWGGRQMKSAGVEILHSIDNLGTVGFSEVVLRIFHFGKLFAHCKKQLRSFCPDTVIFIDFGGFNLRMAAWCKNQGFRTVYFIPPKVWASRESRLKRLREYIDLVVVILPFEKEYFASRGIKTYYAGHPFYEILSDFKRSADFRKHNAIPEGDICALLPGSRQEEIHHHIPVLVAFMKRFPEFTWCLSVAPGVSEKQILKYLPTPRPSNLVLVKEDMHNLLAHSRFALVSSGTASLETALLEIPQMVFYKTGWLNYLIAKHLIKVPFISLPNLILNREVVEELIQDNFTIDKLNQSFLRLQEAETCTRQLREYRRIKQLLHGNRVMRNVAETIISVNEKFR